MSSFDFAFQRLGMCSSCLDWAGEVYAAYGLIWRAGGIRRLWVVFGESTYRL